MELGEALDTYLRTEYLRRRTRAAMGAMWLAPTLVGALMLLGLSLLLSTWTLWPITIYWLAAAPLGCGTVYLYHRRKERRLGVRGEAVPETVAAAGLFVAAALLSGAGGILGHPSMWWVYAARVGWGLPVLGVLVVPPLGAPLAVTLGYLVVAFMKRSQRLVALALGMGGAIFAAGFVVLTIVSKAGHESVMTGVNGVPSGTWSQLGLGIAFRVAPIVVYALILLIAGALFRRDADRRVP